MKQKVSRFRLQLS